ncbi:MAG: GIY-YIG nuclease family protein [Pseudonocardiaceae bacterium]
MTDEQCPVGPTSARQAASSVRNLLKLANDPGVRSHLTTIAEKLQEKADDPKESQKETKTLKSGSKALEEQVASTLETASGVYVYTYPHYYKHPFEPDTGRRLLKVGKAAHGAGKRVLSQARLTGAPETPLLLRVYVSEGAIEAEKAFHKLLDAAQHDRSEGSGAGREWFSTTLEFLDAIAEALKLQVLAADLEQS